ncbi:MAG TPA: hypothetical protein VHO70_20340, partial [Chitinispirillaceae bacterium]|nr:hypothetical protein [Chitinispirillaceae bacterium]
EHVPVPECESQSAVECEWQMFIGDTDIRQPSNSVIISSDRPYNPLEFGNRIMMNICVHHLYYNERILKEDIVNSFVTQHGYPPDTIVGKPKSTESGMLLGFWFKYMKRFHETGIFIRPQFNFTLGLGNTYDGSSQAQTLTNGIDQKIGIRFEPVDTVKNNFFFTTEFDLGYSNTNKHLPFALYSGLRFAFWNRDMLSNEYVSNYENYSWWSIPVGIIVHKPVGPRWSLGCDFTFDFMFSGNMQAVMRVVQTGDEVDFPSVTLGNRCGYRLELIADGMVTESFSIQIIPWLNLYGFGKSNTEYASYNGNGVSTTNNTFPFYEPESATFLSGLNITFTILKSRK